MRLFSENYNINLPSETVVEWDESVNDRSEKIIHKSTTVTTVTETDEGYEVDLNTNSSSKKRSASCHEYRTSLSTIQVSCNST